MRAELLTAATSLPLNLAAPPGPWFWGCGLDGFVASRFWGFGLPLHPEPWRKEIPLTPPHLHCVHTLNDGPGPTLTLDCPQPLAGCSAALSTSVASTNDAMDAWRTRVATQGGGGLQPSWLVLPWLLVECYM